MSSTLTATGPLGEERQSRGRPIPCWTGRRALGVNHLPANCQERLLTIVYIKQGGIQGREGTDVKGGTGSMVGGVKRSKSTTPAPGVLCKAMLEMNKRDEGGVKQSSAHYVYNASWTPMPNHLAIPEPVPRALVVLLGLPILNFSSLRSRGAAGAEPGHRQEAL